MSRSHWIDELRGQIVALDTAPLIYYIEEHPRYLPLLDPFFDAVSQRELRVITSTVTLLEVLVQPLRQRNFQLVDRYRRILLDSNGVRTIPASSAVAEEAARLRADYRLSTPDALQLATAISADAIAILTNDVRFPRLASPRSLILNEMGDT